MAAKKRKRTSSSRKRATKKSSKPKRAAKRKSAAKSTRRKTAKKRKTATKRKSPKRKTAPKKATSPRPIRRDEPSAPKPITDPKPSWEAPPPSSWQTESEEPSTPSWETPQMEPEETSTPSWETPSEESAAVPSWETAEETAWPEDEQEKQAAENAAEDTFFSSSQEPKAMEPEPEEPTWQPAEPEPEPVPAAAPAPPTPAQPVGAKGWSVVEPSAQPAAATTMTTSAAKPELPSTLRNGIPWVRTLGWGLMFLGLLHIAYAYYDVYKGNYDEVLKYGGLGLDVLGAIVLVIGLILMVVFYFVPRQKPSGPQTTDSKEAWLARASKARTRATTLATFAGIGWGLAMLGLIISVLSWYYSWTESSPTMLVEYGRDIAGYSILYWRAGLYIMALGLIVFAITFPRIRGTRMERQASLVAATQSSGTSMAGPSAAAHGVPGADVQQLKALMKKIDGLLAHLPESEVAQFAQTPEAEIYLKLLEERA